MIYMKHPTLGNAHFPVEQLLELESQGWVWWPHGQYMTRPEVSVPLPIETVEQPSPPEPHQPAGGGTPITSVEQEVPAVKQMDKRKPGRPRKS